MSKSKGNVVSVDDMVGKYGADTARLFVLFASPPERDLDWSDEGVAGSFRFLNKVWNLVRSPKSEVRSSTIDENLERIKHLTIKKVTGDIREEFHFNTAIAAIMEFYNEISSQQSAVSSQQLKDYIETLVILLSPFAPHICEEMWRILGNSESILEEKWPVLDETKLIQEKITIAVQLNGKLRGQIEIRTDAAEIEILEIAESDDKIKKYLENKKIIKTIFVPKKLLNIVVGG
ncbi:MAG: class I tRNA ligase family protein [Elusimicrobia bacterium]|nr:class I tRNA ligase family protein [Elusimicrobiota bacterium]